MRRAWLGLFVGLIAGLSGCRSVFTDERQVRDSGFTNVIQAVPEPGITWQESNPTPERTRAVKVKRGGKGSTAEPPNIPPFVKREPGVLATTEPKGMENSFDKLPKADLAKQIPAVALKLGDGPYRVISEAEVRTLAMQYAPAARRIEMENIIPASNAESGKLFHQKDEGCPSSLDNFLRTARELSAKASRVKAVAEAAGKFYDLAEAEGRSEILRAGIASFDEMRAELAKQPAKQMIGGRLIALPIPDGPTLDSQRGQFLETAELVSLSAKTSNIDLKRMTGMTGNTADRLYPTGEFGIDPTPLDVPRLVQSAMENRPDLLLLRQVYFELSEDSLPVIREQLQKQIGFLAPVPKVLGRHLSLLPTALQRFGKKHDLDPILVHELAVRRAQLHDLICEEERKVADDVRKAALLQETAANLVASKRSRSEALRIKVEADRAKSPRNVVAEFGNLIEWYTVRADVISAVMTWHRARVMLMAAQGMN